MIVFVIGVGMGNTMTKEAEEAINCSQCIIGAKRMIESVVSDAEKIEAISGIAGVINQLKYDAVSVLFSGDIGFYSGAKNLYEQLQGHDVRTICGVSTVQYLCAKLKRPWQDMKLLSLHGRDVDVVSAVIKNKECFFLTDEKHSPKYICSEIVRSGLGDVKVTVGERLSYEDENITEGSAFELSGIAFGSLCAVIVDNSKARNFCSGTIEDSEFIRGKTPMTKEEIRSVAIAKLALKQHEIAYDIGGGTGSVSVDMAMRCERVYSIENNEEAAELIRSNREKFCAYNIKIVEGKAPGVLESLPAPDAVFVGGTRGNMAEILKVVVKKNPKVRIVITAIAIETLGLAVSELSKYCEPNIVNMCVSRNKKVASYNMMTAENPIYIISGVCSK